MRHAPRNVIRARLLLSLGSLVAAAGFWWPAFRDPAATGFGDWQFFHHMWEAGRVSLFEHGEWPLFDPFHCGGVTLAGNPQNQTWSPWFLVLTPVFGTTIALKLFVILHAAIGVAGTFVLARESLGVRPLPALLAAMAYCFSGVFAWDGAGGHSTFLSFLYAPWLVLFFRRALDDPRKAAYVALLLVLVLLEGGTYTFPYSGLLLAFEFGRACVLGRVAAALRVAAVTGVLTLLVGAMRLMPILVTLGRHPRQMPSRDLLELPDVFVMLLARDHEWAFPPHEFVWPEYGAFVGPVVVLFGFVGLALAARRGHRALLAGALVFGALMLGHRGSFYPWPILHELPVFDSLRVPSRFSVFFTFYLALGAAFALDALVATFAGFRLRRGLDVARAGVPFVVVALAVVDLYATNHRVVDRWNGPPVGREARSERFHLVPAPDYGAVYAGLPARNLGTPRCYDAVDWPVPATLVTGDVAQVSLAPEGGTPPRGEVRGFSRSPSVVHFEATLATPARVVVNQTYVEGFVADRGRVVDDGGRLAVELPAGTHRVSIRYAPAELLPSVFVSFIGLVATGLTLRFGSVARFRSLAAWLARLVGHRPVRGDLPRR